MISSILSLLFWVIKCLLLYFGLVVGLHCISRTVKIVLARYWKKPVSGSQAVLISGATSGIGLAVAKHLYKVGYSVIIGYYNSQEPGFEELKQLAIERKKINREQKILFVELDVRSKTSTAEAYKKCTKLLSEHNFELYALINNAGLGSLQPFAWLQRSRIEDLIGTNLIGTLLMTREFLPLLVKSKGRILNVSSGLGLVPGSTYATYGITKAAQIYFTRCMNLELYPSFGVKSIAVIPHNYIKNTNICSNNVKENEKAWSELKEEEKVLYKEQFDKHYLLAERLQEETKKHVTKAAKASSNKQNGQTQTNQPVALFPNLLKEFLARLKGENAALTLEHSGALECFEDALRLIDPPQHIFAGDNIYNILVASLLFSWPVSCIDLLGKSVAPSLYR